MVLPPIATKSNVPGAEWAVSPPIAVKSSVPGAEWAVSPPIAVISNFSSPNFHNVNSSHS